MEDKFIRVLGAKEHNLKDVSVNIPRDKLVVITGLSGSGKSSLAFDTIYAEGQRRFVESMSAYARQFLEQMQKPDVEAIEGLPPTISIEQRSGISSPRSTVATVTEIYDYLRLLYARVGDPYCYVCGRPITQQTTQQMVDDVLARLTPGTRINILAPLVRGRKGEHSEVLAAARREGFVRVRLDGRIIDIDDIVSIDKKKAHSIEVVVDRLPAREAIRTRIADSVELALKLGAGIVVISHEDGPDVWSDKVYSELYACPHCMISIEELSPRMFSFNSPYGACQTCDGLGTRLEFDPELIVPDQSLSLQDGAIDAWRRGGKRMAIWYNRILRRFGDGIRREPRRAVRVAGQGPEAHPLVRDDRKGQGGARGGVRRSLAEPHAAVQQHRERVRQGPASWVHERTAVPGLQGRAAEAGGAVDTHRRQEYPRGDGDDHRGGAHLLRGPQALGGAHGDRAGDTQGDTHAADVPSRRRARVHHARPFERDARRRRGAAHKARDAGGKRACRAWRMSSTSRRSGFTSATTRGSSTRLRNSGTWGTRSSSSSMTRRRYARRTTSSTSGRARARTAGAWSPRGRSPSSRRRRGA